MGCGRLCVRIIGDTGDRQKECQMVDVVLVSLSGTEQRAENLYELR